MSCLTTSATRRSRMVPAAVLIASAAASSHDVLLVPMTSVTLYTLMTLSSRRLQAREMPGPAGQHPARSWPGGQRSCIARTEPGTWLRQRPGPPVLQNAAARRRQPLATGRLALLPGDLLVRAAGDPGRDQVGRLRPRGT